jgi:hypothetical protein
MTKLLILAMALATVTPLLGRQPTADAHPYVVLPAWPHEYQGEPLRRVAMSEEELRLLTEFPGTVAHFTDGRRDILMRWVTQATRRLHPAEDCYRAWGFDVAPPRIQPDRDGSRWRCFVATRNGVRREVCEQIRDAEGVYFSDVSAWYWSAMLDRSHGPWLVTTVARTTASQP